MQNPTTDITGTVTNAMLIRRNLTPTLQAAAEYAADEPRIGKVVNFIKAAVAADGVVDHRDLRIGMQRPSAIGSRLSITILHAEVGILEATSTTRR